MLWQSPVPLRGMPAAQGLPAAHPAGFSHFHIRVSSVSSAKTSSVKLGEPFVCKPRTCRSIVISLNLRTQFNYFDLRNKITINT